ncbi:MAG TPA: primosome assembly protein PriA, partial [Nocardioides sp.]
LGPDQHVSLTADSGPAARYRDFLRVSRGAVRVVVGTRAAAYAPVHDLGLVAIWDDGDDLHAEPRAPYPHTREILLTRAELEGTAALIGGHARTVEAHYLVTTGWAVELSAGREVVRRALRVNVAGSSDHDLERDAHARTSRIPRQVFEGIRAALETGPVLVQTPRAGYAATLACERCRTPARCTACQGPLRQPRAESVPECGWCGTAAGDFRCVECGHRGLRAPVRGDARTAEELGRMFPRTLIRTSSGDRVLDTVGATPAIVVATPGAEPVAAQGYSAVVLLDTWLALARVDLRTPEEAVRRWMNAAALTRRGGNVLVVGDPAHPTIQALVRWDPAGFAERELEERRSAHLPPASRLATLTGPTGAVDDAVTVLTLPDGAELLGPLALEDTYLVRAVIRAPRRAANALSESLLELQRVRSSRKLDPVRVQVDPYAL